MLKDEIIGVKNELASLTNKVSPEDSDFIRGLCRSLESIGGQVGCLEAHFTVAQNPYDEECLNVKEAVA